MQTCLMPSSDGDVVSDLVHHTLAIKEKILEKVILVGVIKKGDLNYDPIFQHIFWFWSKHLC